jgi:N-acetylglutamate synthase-like GNAT family acetyltransferase
MLKIRRYKPGDNQSVKELHRAGNAQMAEMLTEAERKEMLSLTAASLGTDLDDIKGAYINNGGDFLVGLEGKEIVAIGAIRKYTDTCGELKRLRVRRDRQRNGYGETMFRRLIERGKELGYRELILDTLTADTAAQRLFKKCGFAEVRREKHGPFNLSTWEKKLKEGE